MLKDELMHYSNHTLSTWIACIGNADQIDFQKIGVFSPLLVWSSKSFDGSLLNILEGVTGIKALAVHIS